MVNYKYWVAVAPIGDNSYTIIDKKAFMLDKDLVELTGMYLGEKTILLSAGLWDGFLPYDYIKQGEQIFVDSGGFQFYYMTPGRLREFMLKRDGFYRFQVKTGDYIAGGDIAVGADLDEEQLKWYVELTQKNMEYQYSLDKEKVPKIFVNIMHGISPRNMGIWYDGVKRFGGVGWALGAKGTLVYSSVMQLLFLYEKGELTNGKLLHFFGMSGIRTLPALIWLCRQLKIDVTLSSDSSSYNLMRFGAMFYEGDVIHYDKIRAGKEITLWNGNKLKDVPQKIGFDLSRDLMLTGLKHFLIYVRDNIIAKKDASEEELRDLIELTEVGRILKWFKIGGVELVYARYSSKVIGKSETRLVDRLELDAIVVNRRTKKRRRPE